MLSFSEPGRLARLFCLTIVLFASSSCGIFSPEERHVEVDFNKDEIIIRNETDSRIYIATFGQKDLAVINWAPALDDKSSIAPNHRKKVQLNTIRNIANETGVVVFWWTAIVKNGERVPGEIQGIGFSLK